MNDSSKKHDYQYSQGLVIGLVVIAVGVYFLLRNLGFDLPFLYMHNWWALFILVAAVGPLTQAIHAYRKRSRMDAVVIRYLLTALIIVTVALVFLLEVSWARWWPVFVIYGGLWMLFREHRDTD